MNLIENGVALVPYVEMNGTRLITDEIVDAFWDTAKSEGVATLLFGSNGFTGATFLEMLKTPSTLPVFLFRTGEVSPVGVGWMNHLCESHALCHFFFSARRGEENHRRWGGHSRDTGSAWAIRH